MTKLIDRAIEAAGLRGIVAARRDGAPLEPYAARLRAADLLALGALADRVRAEEMGAEVRIHTSEPREPRDPARSVTVLPSGARNLTGLDLLREVAIARVVGPRGARVRVDWTRCGLELAQVALGFGADELVGFIANKRGLPLADGEMSGVGKRSRQELAEVAKRRELAGCIERAGRVPIFVRADGVVEALDAVQPGFVEEAM